MLNPRKLPHLGFAQEDNLCKHSESVFQIVCVRVANNELDILKRAFMYDVGSDVVSAIADCNYGETHDYRSFSAMAAQASASANA